MGIRIEWRRLRLFHRMNGCEAGCAALAERLERLERTVNALRTAQNGAEGETGPAEPDASAAEAPAGGRDMWDEYLNGQAGAARPGTDGKGVSLKEIFDQYLNGKGGEETC